MNGQSFHINILLLLGIALFGGTVGGRLFQKLRIPQVVGYIMIGALLGQSGLGIVDLILIRRLEPLSYFALGLIGFMIGGELKRDVLAKYGRQFLTILLCEGLTSFVVVTAAATAVGLLLFDDLPVALGTGLMLGAIASATAPAATTDVLREYKTRGPLTTTIYGIVALDDALALMLFAVAASVASKLLGTTGLGLATFLQPLYEILGSVVVGGVLGYVLSKLLRKYTDQERTLSFSTGMTLLMLGISQLLQVDVLLSAMAFGCVTANRTPRRSRDVFELVSGFAQPIYVLFFVLVGATIDVRHATGPILALTTVYLIGRLVGKVVGSHWGARLAHAPSSVQRYLPWCLFSQAGVAIGLSVLVAHRFPGEVGERIVVAVTLSTFVVQLLGPIFMRIAVTRSGEVGLGVNEEDLLSTTPIQDALDSAAAVIYADEHLHDILVRFTQTPHLYCAVVDREQVFQGVISIEQLKDVLLETELDPLLVAADIMRPITRHISSEAPLLEARETMRQYGLECVPIAGPNEMFFGLIEQRDLDQFLAKKLLVIQRQAEALS